MTLRLRSAAGGAVLAAGLALTAGCSGDTATAVFRDPAVPPGSFQLVAFESCDDALGRLKEAAKQYVGPWGFGSQVFLNGAGRDAVAVPPAAAADAAGGAEKSMADPQAPQQGSDYSGTNTHEKGVDEPDLVKTDGERIITVTDGVLRVIDARSRRVVDRVDLAKDGEDQVRWSEGNVLLHGDQALVLVPNQFYGPAVRPGGVVGDGPNGKPAPVDPGEITGPQLLLVNLGTGNASLAGSYTIDGSLVDARQVGATARVVVRSGPRVNFPYNEKQNDAQRITANKAVIDQAGPDEWLPRYEFSADGRTTKGRVGCDRISRPATYTGTSMLTVLSFDLGASTLASGDPVTVVADGETVYSNGTSLYVASDQRWRVMPAEGGDAKMPDPLTEIYKFDTSKPGRPRYVAAGSVPGWLLNQYSMSEWDGHLRVATTSATTSATIGRQRQNSESAVYVLRQRGKQLVEAGKVTGLGKGERIYAVRFVGTVGYVVTFRQTDPLYTVDLRDPAEPIVTGELKITGYSAYLHPVGDTRLIGIGQEADRNGRVQGTQVSLFDVSDLTRPDRVGQYHVRYAHSEAEFDPHAFLYWEKTGTLVVPLMMRGRGSGGGEALVLTVTNGSVTEVGSIEHPDQVRRSLIIDNTLWTVSATGLKASDLTTLQDLAWIPLRR